MTTNILIHLAGFVLSVGAGIGYAYATKENKSNWRRVILGAFALYAAASILIVVFLWANHILFSYDLVALEGIFVEVVRRVQDGLPIYPVPSADFIPFAYQPLYYYLSAPFVAIFGLNFSTLRFVSVIATLGSLVIIFLAVRKETGSRWWALIAAGLFAAAYRVLDNNLERPHPDAYLLFLTLLAGWLISLSEKPVFSTVSVSFTDLIARKRVSDLLAVLLTVMAFWIKQQGIVFAVGILIYLTWRQGWRKTLPLWILAAVLGPLFYFAMPDWVFGPYFHYFTWDVPKHWTQLDADIFRRFGEFVAQSYPLLALVSIATLILNWRGKMNIWVFLTPFAILVGFLGVLDPGSSNNVFIPMGVWFILTGSIGLWQLTIRFPSFERRGMQFAAIGISFVVLFFNPIPVIASPNGASAYKDLIAYLDSLDGTVYAPWIGQLPDTSKLYPKVNWVAMEDIIRGPGVEEQDHPTTREIFASLIAPQQTTYILMNYPLEDDPMLGFMGKYYALEADLGERFAALGPLAPTRWNLLYPRYLYKYSAAASK